LSGIGHQTIDSGSELSPRPATANAAGPAARGGRHLELLRVEPVDRVERVAEVVNDARDPHGTVERGG
jgi:hypothetical protein